MENRRRDERFTWTGKVKVEEAKTRKLVSSDSRLRNVAKHGFGFVTEDHLTRGAEYHLTVMLGSSSFDVTVRIVHFHIESTYYVCGAKIEKLSLLERSRINHFLASKSPKLQQKFIFYSVLAGVLVAGAVKLMSGASIAVAITTLVFVAIGSFLLLPF